MAEPVIAPVRAVFRALAVSFVPEAATLEERDWTEVERIVEEALAPRPAKVRRQLGLLIRLLDVMPLLRHGRRFTALEADERLRYLSGLQDSRLLLLRRGIWGLRTLAFMGYYARPELMAEIGYRADSRGWEARR